MTQPPTALVVEDTPVHGTLAEDGARHWVELSPTTLAVDLIAPGLETQRHEVPLLQRRSSLPKASGSDPNQAFFHGKPCFGPNLRAPKAKNRKIEDS